MAVGVMDERDLDLAVAPSVVHDGGLVNREIAAAGVFAAFGGDPAAALVVRMKL
jgi:hypothetical protein